MGRTACTVLLLVVCSLSLLTPSRAQTQPAKNTEKYRVLTKNDALSCTFSQTLSASVGGKLTGTITAAANHFECSDDAGDEGVNVELTSAELENGKVAIRTKNFGTIYRGNEAGSFYTYEMTDSQIQELRTFLKAEGVQLLSRVEPTYPPLARRARIQGRVVLEVLISTTGIVKDVHLVQGHPMLAPAALEAVKQWRYKPHVVAGKPVEVRKTVAVVFSLPGN
jgi:TonB family protein